MLLAQARKLRRFVSVETEIKVRNSLYKIMPTKHRCKNDNIFHACVWKTASQWVRLVLSDPRVYRYSGLTPAPSNPYLKPNHKNADPALTTFPNRSIILTLYQSYDFMQQVRKPENNFTFFVKRDPRDLVVSFYFSNRFSHRENQGVVADRQELQNLSEQEGLLHTLDQFRKFVPILTSWEEAAKTDNRIRVVRYEDLTGENRVDCWHQLLNAADVRIPRDVMAEIVDTYAFEKITGGREKGVEASTEKYRKGIAGDWKNYFDNTIMSAFRDKYGVLPEKLGYES